MTQPFHARDIPGKGRYYGPCQDGCPLPSDPLLLSVTNAQSVIAKPALVPAAAKATAAAAWDQLPRMVATSRQPETGACAKLRVAERCGRCRFCITAQIKAAHKNEWEAKAELGTRVHIRAHAHVTGRPLPFDEEVAPFLNQYLAFLHAWRVDLDRHVEAAELTVYDTAKGFAGTGDIWLHLPIDTHGRFTAWNRRKLVLVDIKTSLTKPAGTVYQDQVLQLAGLRYATHALLPDDTALDVPKFTAAALLNLRTTAHALIPLPADRSAYKAFLGAVELQRYFHGLDTKAWTAVDADPAPEPEKDVA